MHPTTPPKLVGITDDDWGVWETADGRRICGPMPHPPTPARRTFRFLLALELARLRFAVRGPRRRRLIVAPHPSAPLPPVELPLAA